MRIFCCAAKDSHIFSTKSMSIFGYKVEKHLTSRPLNELVKLTMFSAEKYVRIFCCAAKYSHIFPAKSMSIFGYKVEKHLTSRPLNELVKLTMFSTTGSRCLHLPCCLGHKFSTCSFFWLLQDFQNAFFIFSV